MRLLVNLHDCALSCQGYPGYLAVMEAPIPGLGEEMTVGAFVLGSLGVLLIFLCLSGAVIWWPTIRRFATGFRVRRGRGAYVRDLDLHKLVGIIALPLLLSSRRGPPRWRCTRVRAWSGCTRPRPAEDGGNYGFYLRQGFDAYKDSYYQGQIYVQVDSHGGGTTDYPKSGGTVTQQYWENWQNGLHFGSLVPWIPRLPGVVFGLTPILLAITGITVWLTKRRSRRNRARRARLDAAAAATPHTASASVGSSP